MTTIAQIMGLNTQPLDKESKDIALNCGIGIEVELEDVPYLEIPYWNCIEDGSLRNGREFVCSRPYSGIQLKKAIINFSTAMDAARPNGTWRCSTHVHMDMRNSTVSVLKKTILAYVFYERLLYGCSGEHRYHSNFAPAMNAVQDQLLTLAEHWNRPDEHFLRHVVHVWDKYSSLNLKPLGRYGSVELRISEPKWQKENLMLLVNRMLTLKLLAEQSPEDETYEGFVDKLWELGVLPMRDYLVSDYVFEQTHLETGYINAHDILSLRSDGSVIHDTITEANPTELNDDTLVQVPSQGHWSNILQYITSHERDGGESNRALNSPYSNTQYGRVKRYMRDALDNGGVLTYSQFNSVLSFFTEHGDSALRGAFQRVREEFDEVNN